MKPIQRVCRLVRLSGPVLAEALRSNALCQVLAASVHGHMFDAVLTLLQCFVYLLLKILYSRKRESGQICLHRIPFGFPAFEQVHAGCGDECVHIGQSLFGDHNLMLYI